MLMIIKLRQTNLFYKSGIIKNNPKLPIYIQGKQRESQQKYTLVYLRIYILFLYKKQIYVYVVLSNTNTKHDCFEELRKTNN